MERERIFSSDRTRCFSPKYSLPPIHGILVLKASLSETVITEDPTLYRFAPIIFLQLYYNYSRYPS